MSDCAARNRTVAGSIRPRLAGIGVLAVFLALVGPGCAGPGTGGPGSILTTGASVPVTEPASPPASASTQPAGPVEFETIAPVEPVPPDRTVEESGGFRLTSLSSASCLAEGPGDWAMTAPDKSDRADLFSPEGTLYAGYGIQAVNTTLQAFAGDYPAPLNDPDLYSEDPATVAVAYGRIVVAGIGGSSDLVADELYQATADYQLATVASSSHRGVVFFRVPGFPGDGFNYTYALPMYFAFTTLDRWDTEGLLVARVAASIRCSTQFQPPDDYPIVVAPDDGGAADANGDDAGYNPQLGTESVYDPTTGENYLVDPSVNWSATGPDGAGYYVPKAGGNDYQKLEPGRSD